MGKAIYVDFQERKRVDDPQIRSELVVGRLETYKRIASNNLAISLKFGGFLKELIEAIKGSN